MTLREIVLAAIAFLRSGKFRLSEPTSSSEDERNERQSNEHSTDDPSSSETPTTYTYEEALKFAELEAKRIVQSDRQAVRYVKYEKFFQDYCEVSFVFDQSGRARMMLRMLALDERQSDEHFTDEHILSVARAGHILDAIRLYRLLHSADLLTAKRAVEAMLKPT